MATVDTQLLVRQNKNTDANIFYDKKQAKIDKIKLQIYAG